MTALVKAKTIGDYKPLAPSADLPKALVDTVHKALATDPAQRFGSAADFGKELESVLRGLVRERAYSHLQDLARKFWA
jgi:hypothetical protein